MKDIFDQVSGDASKRITKKYSTSFSMAVKLLHPTIRQDIYNIYGFVRVADEIVDSFNAFNQEELLDRFEEELWYGVQNGISSNPVIHAFQSTVTKYEIPNHLISAFLDSMRADLTKKIYANKEEIDKYIYGSADVVGLMCLIVFVKGNKTEYERLKASAIKLGSAFQKVNFLRDLKQDSEELQRAYFPNVDLQNFTEEDKNKIIREIKKDFNLAKEGIVNLPKEARLGVYLAYIYYSKLLQKMVHTPSNLLKENRIRVSNQKKTYLLVLSFMRYKFNLL